MLLYEIRPGFKSSFQVQSWEVKFPDSLCLFYHQLKDVSYIFKSAEDTCISSHLFLPRLFPFPLVLVPLIFFFLSLPSLLYGFPPTVGISSHWLHVKEDKSSVSGRSRHASWRWWRHWQLSVVGDIKVQQRAHFPYYYMGYPMISSCTFRSKLRQHVSAVFNSSVTTNLCC